MFDNIGKPNLTNLLILGAIGVILPRLLPEMRPAVGTAVKLVIDLLTESEAEAAEELVEALVSGTIAEINAGIAGADDPEEGRRSVERSIAQFKHNARRRAHRWGRDGQLSGVVQGREGADTGRASRINVSQADGVAPIRIDIAAGSV